MDKVKQYLIFEVNTIWSNLVNDYANPPKAKDPHSNPDYSLHIMWCKWSRSLLPIAARSPTKWHWDPLKATLCHIQPMNPELALSGLTESWGAVRLALATDSAGRWVVWSDDTEDTACLLESLPHLHLVGRTQTASDSRAFVSDSQKQNSKQKLRSCQVKLRLRLRVAKGCTIDILLGVDILHWTNITAYAEFQQCECTTAVIIEQMTSSGWKIFKLLCFSSSNTMTRKWNLTAVLFPNSLAGKRTHLGVWVMPPKKVKIW